MTDVSLAPGVSAVTPRLRVALSVDETAVSTFEPLVQQVAEVVLDPYVVLEGQPEADSEHGGRIDFDGGSAGTTLYPVAPLPETLDLKTWRRWLPYAEWLTAPAAGGRRWWPIETAPGDMVATGVGVSGVPEPRIALYTTVDPATGFMNGRGSYDPVLSPGIDESYSFHGYEQEMVRKAMVFDSTGHASIETEATMTEITIGLVVVFHPSNLPYYGVFEASQSNPDVGTPGEPLVLRYSHGQFIVYQQDVRVLQHETHKNAHEACIILLSMSATDDAGRLLVIDHTRTTREFAIPNLDFVSFGGVFGALGQVTTASPVRFSSEMDLLELDIWDRALTFPELEEKANLLSLGYGIAG